MYYVYICVCIYIYKYKYIYIYIYIKFLSDERLGAKFRFTENRCVLFNSLTYV